MTRLDDEPRDGSFLQWKDEPACAGCIYYRRVHRHGGSRYIGKICHYLLDTGHARGCPFGDGCTKKQVKDRT